MDEKTVAKMLKDIKNSCDKNNIIFWLRDGTILGAVRDKKVIPWDSDIDIGIWRKDFEKLYFVQIDMNNLGYETLIHNDEIPPSLNIVKNDCNMDIAAYTSKNGKISTEYVESKGLFGEILNYLLWILNLRIEVKEDRIPHNITKKIIKFCKIIPNNIRDGLILFLNDIYKNKATNHFVKTIPSHYYMNLSKINFYGTQVNIPTEIDDYLLFRYGKDWKTPKKFKKVTTGMLKGSSLKKRKV